jgi:hypothetical protein
MGSPDAGHLLEQPWSITLDDHPSMSVERKQVAMLDRPTNKSGAIHPKQVTSSSIGGSQRTYIHKHAHAAASAETS